MTPSANIFDNWRAMYVAVRRTNGHYERNGIVRCENTSHGNIPLTLTHPWCRPFGGTGGIGQKKGRKKPKDSKQDDDDEGGNDSGNGGAGTSRAVNASTRSYSTDSRDKVRNRANQLKQDHG